MALSHAGLAAKYLAVDLVGSFVYFPVWWYTRGMVRTGAYCLRTVRHTAQSFGLTVWLKNLFTPMYGQYDIQGRIISFFIRLVAIAYYAVFLLVESVIMTAVFLAWLAFPLFVGFEFFNQAIGMLKAFGI